MPRILLEDKTGQLSSLKEAWRNQIHLLQNLQQEVGYFFKDVNLIMEAMTHSSAAREHSNHSRELVWNERLEFLGDSVLSLVITTRIMLGSNNLNEGELSKIRASVVQERSLAAAAQRINLGECLLLSKGEERSGGRKKASLLADAFEALVGAVYLDGGFSEAEKVLSRILPTDNMGDWSELLICDYKTHLQEMVQQSHRQTPHYQLVDSTGPSHAPQFIVNVMLEEEVIGTGSGHSKKVASQNAAMHALERFAENKA